MQPAAILEEVSDEALLCYLETCDSSVSFYHSLERDLVDSRGKQGQQHYLPFVVFGFIVAVLCKKQTKSSIQRFMVNKHAFLCKLTGHVAKRAVSPAQLGRILSGLDWLGLNSVHERHLGLPMGCEVSATGELLWLSGDGKDLRGGVEVNSTNTSCIRGEVSIRLIEQDSHKIIAQSFYDGDKNSEKTHMRQLIEDKGLAHRAIALDAIHCDPKTTELIAANMGTYLIPAKDNQAYLLKDLKSEARRQREDKRWIQLKTLEKGHGRIDLREYTLFDVSQQCFDERWHSSNIQSLVVVYRQRETLSKHQVVKKEEKTSYFISNMCAKQLEDTTLKQLSKAIRRRWTIESDNYIRDVTFGEDKIRTQKGNRTRAEATLRTIALEWIKIESPKNIAARLDEFADSEAVLTNFLKKYKFIN